MSPAAQPAPRLSIVVPLYNEEDNVELMVREIRQALEDDFELLLVDDGSTDSTVQRIPREPFIRLLQFDRNAGQSAAMFAGIMAARGEIFVLLDGDLQNDPADIPKLLRGIEQGADLVCGYRAKRQDSLSKRMQSRLANWFRRSLTKDGVRDTGCTLKAMRRQCRDAIFPFTGMHRFIPALVAAAGFKVIELPVNHRPRRYGVSKYGFGNRAIRATIDLLGVAWLRRRRFRYRPRENNSQPGA
ncbi:MAG: glycosyltransferase family 2 protein [Verrucomicrobiales bacterium]